MMFWKYHMKKRIRIYYKIIKENVGDGFTMYLLYCFNRFNK